MTPIAPLMLAQALPPELAADLDRIALAQTVMAVVMVVAALAMIAVALAAIWLLIRLNRLARRTQEVVQPRLDPILDRARTVADDASHVSATVREEVASLRRTVEELNRQVREAIDATEKRVRQFGTVLDVVQEQTEDVLLDAAATARGVQATGEALQRPRPRKPRAQG